jgi:hypothetical protein
MYDTLTWSNHDEKKEKEEMDKFYVIRKIARICHQANKAYCVTLGDFSQEDWDQAPEWQRESAIKGVEAILEENLTPEQCHISWMKHKLTDGWVYGEEKNENKKTHPCMIPYDDLPKEQKLKDKLFHAIVNCFKE